jgi:hypothetical protein
MPPATCTIEAHMRLTRFFALFTLLTALDQSAVAELVSLNPIKDNTLIQGTNPTTQLSNGQGDLSVGRTNQDLQGPATVSIRRGLIAFDIAGSIPAASTITEVTLIMRETSGMNGDRSVSVHRLLGDWGEGASFQGGGMGAPAQEGDATWLYTFFNAANPSASPTWAAPGGDFSPNPSASRVIIDDLGPGILFSWQSLENPHMLADVQTWLDNPAANFGWLLRGDESAGQTIKRLNSGESTLSPNIPPVLTINYVIPEPGSLAISVITALGAMVLTAAGRQRFRTR